ncbi:AAA family ATPase [Dehalobacterium formicoaceticum]|uniref:MoxR family ATPase n=1 Tax=Dehalobacterium formicoaceticum TaxID=51515 RepID=A0ABT1Y471_9FIRM|nr:MoxR family ATPase [Dehalobacterium formicoaceticum]MCR6544466.1 MoxR family ATPase [Dehalobacterium formicoaceticum]
MNFSVNELEEKFRQENYISDQDILVPVYLALKLEKPLLITGAPGVGKTEIAKVLSRILDTELIRLQCYEGLDENKALYEWNYQKQLLHIQASKDSSSIETEIFSKEYLLERPLLKAISQPKKVVLLIDEIDKTDAEFEAFLFEVLSDFQVSVPEIGTILAKEIPVVVLTSNGERDLSDGLKRRCIFLHIDFPSPEKETEIIKAKVPQLGTELTWQLARGVAYLRTQLALKKKPSISETLDWAQALLTLNAQRMTEHLVDQTISLLLKDKDDLDLFREKGGAKAMLKQTASAESSASGHTHGKV